jgi:hypothetical protein
MIRRANSNFSYATGLTLNFGKVSELRMLHPLLLKIDLVEILNPSGCCFGGSWSRLRAVLSTGIPTTLFSTTLLVSPASNLRSPIRL